MAFVEHMRKAVCDISNQNYGYIDWKYQVEGNRPSMQHPQKDFGSDLTCTVYGQTINTFTNMVGDLGQLPDAWPAALSLSSTGQGKKV